MSKNSAAREAKIEHCVQTLLRAPMLTVPEGMILARFSQKDVADASLRRLITRRLPGGTKGSIDWDSSRMHSTLSPLTAEDSPAAASAGVSMSVDDRIQHPKRKQQRMTASAVQQKRKKHKSDAHKEAVRLYDKERSKSDGGMSLRQVVAQVEKKYGVTPSYSTIRRYAIEGLVDASPKKTGPDGNLPKAAYKLLCDAFATVVAIHQLNARAGDHTRRKSIIMLMKTFDIPKREASKLLEGHMEALKKKELLLAARVMSQEEFDQLVADRNASLASTNSTPSDAPPENEFAVESHHNSNATIDTPQTGEDEGGV